MPEHVVSVAPAPREWEERAVRAVSAAPTEQGERAGPASPVAATSREQKERAVHVVHVAIAPPEFSRSPFPDPGATPWPWSWCDQRLLAPAGRDGAEGTKVGGTETVALEEEQKSE